MMGVFQLRDCRQRGECFHMCLLPLLEGKPVIHSAGLATTCKIFHSFLAHLDLRLDLLHTP